MALYGTASAPWPPLRSGASRAATVVSDPLAELVGAAGSMKEVKACTELFLGGRGIERLHGFGPLTGLQVLWLGGNALRTVTGLDANSRLQELYLQDNRIRTLKGSLARLRFLQTLDLGGNELRGLDKVLAGLEKLPHLRHLNLQGNPCCEEPKYRPQAVHRLPRLEVLDWHQVTDDERRRASESFSSNAAAPAVAFGRRAPADHGWRERAPRQSVLEQELAERVRAVREARLEEQRLAELAAYARNPDSSFWMPRGPPPPPPGLASLRPPAPPGAAGAGARAGGSLGDDVGHCGRGCGAYVARDVYVMQRHAAAPPAGHAPPGKARWEVTSVALRV